MATTKKIKYKNLTNSEKKEVKEIRQQLIKEGILPPDKKKLNRKKFAIEVVKEYEKTDFDFHLDSFYFTMAISQMIPHLYDDKLIHPVTLEQIGVLKVLKIVMELKKSYKEKMDNGEITINILEMYESIIEPISEL